MLISCPNCGIRIDVPETNIKGVPFEHVVCGNCFTKFPMELAIKPPLMLPEEIPWSPWYKGVDVWNLSSFMKKCEEYE